MGKIKNNLIRLLGGVPFEDYSKGLKDYKEFCDKLIKEWEAQQLPTTAVNPNYVATVKNPITLLSSRTIEQSLLTDDVYLAAKKDILKELAENLDKQNLIAFSETTNNSDNLVKIDAMLRVIEP